MPVSQGKSPTILLSCSGKRLGWEPPLLSCLRAPGADRAALPLACHTPQGRPPGAPFSLTCSPPRRLLWADLVSSGSAVPGPGAVSGIQEGSREAEMLAECVNGRAWQPLFFIATPVSTGFLTSRSTPELSNRLRPFIGAADSDSGNMMFRRIRNDCHPWQILKILETRAIICSNSFISQNRKHDIICCAASNTAHRSRISVKRGPSAALGPAGFDIVQPESQRSASAHCLS